MYGRGGREERQRRAGCIFDTAGLPGLTRTILLLGSDHTDLGDIIIEELPPNLAIGITRGRFPKGYAHIDPNEDAVFAATNDTTTVLVVADGHQGFDAANTAITGSSANGHVGPFRPSKGIGL